MDPHIEPGFGNLCGRRGQRFDRRHRIGGKSQAPQVRSDHESAAGTRRALTPHPDEVHDMRMRKHDHPVGTGHQCDQLGAEALWIQAGRIGQVVQGDHERLARSMDQIGRLHCLARCLARGHAVHVDDVHIVHVRGEPLWFERGNRA